MSTAARKARKRAGLPFVREAKVGTPVTERAEFAALIPGAYGTRNAGKLVPRSRRARTRMLVSRGWSEKQIVRLFNKLEGKK